MKNKKEKKRRRLRRRSLCSSWRFGDRASVSGVSIAWRPWCCSVWLLSFELEVSNEGSLVVSQEGGF